ncbi:MAG: hypothetical protein A3G32_01110 [Deltaproteobacteria bacterium RIFCSPLOWO2_12_FULL_40_28]|nr:MAG: hypothetical protein A3C45_09995 [Deltaproteobacteria bacterium RIFCSPHIGHO2_02_FULL_40_28]OGQ19933.1 MAG: hypothetical protein A3E27_06945 [Deltaproteobacteria bacterium RIFCSPHIGHO2_12_FULL_40_32]OGQ39692.1 MAG: hypothetical protein A3I69_06375 [Deltaproteobacteria bacterium RIFCSPLOWO2_02_FULL_40_36]OGQ52948.1 MAG: hypothetical protein A3G32_01110 [Deltaproteobacteria bacterium RIFCSPLOWO2_12_FULL_40_28]
MTKVKIAKLKAHLSRYLRAAQKGEEIIVTDRNTEVAKIIPFFFQERLPVILPAKRPVKNLAKIKRPNVKTKTDPVKFLLENRKERG